MEVWCAGLTVRCRRADLGTRGAIAAPIARARTVHHGRHDSVTTAPCGTPRRRSKYAVGSQITPSSALVDAKTRCAARLKANKRGAVAYSPKKKIQAACVVPRCATVTGNAASMKITGRNVSIWLNGMWMPKACAAKECRESDTKNIGARHSTIAPEP